MISARWLGSALCLILLTACGGPEPEEVSKRTSTILSSMMTDIQETTRAAGKLDTVASLLDALDRLNLLPMAETVNVTEPVPPPARESDGAGWAPEGDSREMERPDEDRADAPPCIGDRCDPVYENEQDWLDEVDAAVQELETFLDEKIFTTGNVDSSSFGSTTFIIRGEDICAQFTSRSVAVPCSSMEGESEVRCGVDYEPVEADTSDERDECVELVNSLEISLDASLEGDEGVTLALLVPGATVLILELQPGSVTLKAPLEEIRTAIEEVGLSLGEELSGLPEVMKGVIAISVVRNAPLDLTAKVAFLESIDVQGQTIWGLTYQMLMRLFAITK